MQHRCTERGFTLHEALWGVVVLATALMGHAASTFSEHRLDQASAHRSEAIHVTRQFIERLRADEDFAGLLARIRVRQIDGSLPGAVLLQDGRVAYPPSDLCPGFVLPESLDSMVVRVALPLRKSLDGDLVLREDVDEPFYGLPADLNGDGVIDDVSRNDDYRALPIHLTFQWQAPGHAEATLGFATWLRGVR